MFSVMNLIFRRKRLSSNIITLMLLFIPQTSICAQSVHGDLEQILDSFRSKTGDERIEAAREIRGFAELVPLLTEAAIAGLSDENKYVRRESARALGAIGNPREDIVHSLTSVLHDDYYWVRAMAAEALGKLGPRAKEASPELVRLMDDSNSFVRQMAIRGLAGVKADSPDAIDSLIRTLKEGVGLLPKESANALGRIGKNAITLVAAELPNADTGLREYIGDALTIAGQEAVPLLTKLLESDNPETREIAARCLGRIGSDAVTAVPMLLNMKDDPFDYVRETSSWAVEMIDGVPNPVD